MYEFFESDQEWMTLEDYCLERDLLLDQSQLIKAGQAITRYLRTNNLPGPQKLPHVQYGSVNGYRRCSLDRWYDEFMARPEPSPPRRESRSQATVIKSRRTGSPVIGLIWGGSIKNVGREAE